jgi:PAS domain S-box-containing protein
MDFIWADDRDEISIQFARIATSAMTSSRHESRYSTKSGGYRWVEANVTFIRDQEGRLVATCGTLTDITDRQRNETLSKGEHAVLKAILGGAALEVVLDIVCYLTQNLIPESRCSILLLDKDKKHLHHGSGPALPVEYMAAIDGAEIGPNAGSCGTSTFSRRTVIVSDIATDPLWRNYRHLALKHGLRACWSFPIMVENGEVHGAIAVYHEKAHAPENWHLLIARRLARLAAVSIMHQQANEALRISEERYALAVEGANSGIFDWDIKHNSLYWSPLFKEMVGLPPGEDPVPLITFPQLLHPDDRERVMEVLNKHLTQRKPYDTEYRIRLPDGSYRWMHAKAQAVWDEDGQATRISPLKIGS